jgi:hypothetical protein
LLFVLSLSKRSSVIHTVFACSVSSHRLRWILDTLRRIAHAFFFVHSVRNVLSIISLYLHATSHVALTCLYPLSLFSICYLASHICFVHRTQYESRFKLEMRIGSYERVMGLVFSLACRHFDVARGEKSLFFYGPVVRSGLHR